MKEAIGGRKKGKKKKEERFITKMTHLEGSLCRPVFASCADKKGMRERRRRVEREGRH